MASTPRWVDAITKALALPENKGQVVYQVASRDPYGPRVRSQIHREILYPEGHSQYPIFLTTTDVRTPKVSQMINHPRIEIAWWMAGSQDQFRISGTARIVPHESHPSFTKRLSDGLNAEGFTLLDGDRINWEQKRQVVFNSMSSHMRASWCRPPPGSVIPSYDEAKKWPSTVPKIGEAENDEDLENQKVAFKNFALVLVDPVEVDWVQLGVVPNQRTRFRAVQRGDDRDWEADILVP